LNADWKLTVGRAQLASSAPGADDAQNDNLQVADCLGEALAGSFKALEKMLNDWPTVVSKLQLRADLRPYDFWLSLWDILIDEMQSGSKILHQVFWSPKGAMSELMRQTVWPSGLWGLYQVLVCWNKVKWMAEGSLARQNVFEIVSQWSEFENRWGVGELACVFDFKNLKRLGVELGGAQLLSLRNVLDEIVDCEYVTAVWAKRLQALWEVRRELSDFEIEWIQQWGRNRPWRCADDNLKSLHDLVCHYSSDDGLIYDFAPPCCRLHEKYEDAATNFFIEMQGSRQDDPECLANWGCAAEEEFQKKAFVQYLAKGKVGAEVQWRVKKRVASTWLAQIESSHSLFENMSKVERASVLDGLGLAG
jgi:hypothetical protein